MNKNIKDLYLEFFKTKEHVIIPSSPIIPENDPTVLFNTAGMQPLIPYLMGEKHPLGTRLANTQKCFRSNDLEAIGDKTHHTFFEMLGNWSLGDYFKKESITWSFEFLTTVLNIPLSHLAVTVFAGNDLVSKDLESAKIWEDLGVSKNRICFLEDNWWALGSGVGPCGPDTEIFYFRSNDPVPEIFDPNDERWVEIWNNVFTQYNVLPNGQIEELKNKNVDTGMGVERVTAILEGVSDNYETSIFKDIISYLETVSNQKYEDENVKHDMRIIADHLRAVTIIAGDNALIKPSNTDQGYILRRLIRRVIRYGKKLGIANDINYEVEIAKMYIDKYNSYYKELEINKEAILKVLTDEKVKFNRTLEKGLKEFSKIATKDIDATSAFHLYDTYGFPIELTEELANELGYKVDVLGFKEKFIEHQEKSRLNSGARFKGGLASDSVMNIKYHTATHLLNAALKKVVGPNSHQKGSNITDERMRFDFSCDHKLTEEEKSQVEQIVNGWINDSLEVTYKEENKIEALNSGAECEFADRYPDIVKVYSIGTVSKEICGGPHVNNTSELGKFKIIKEEAASSGVRRIKAILE